MSGSILTSYFLQLKAREGGKGGGWINSCSAGGGSAGRHFPGRGDTVAGGDSDKKQPGVAPGAAATPRGGPGTASTSGGRNGNGKDFPLKVLG